MIFGLPRLSAFGTLVLVVQTLFGAWYLVHGLNYFVDFFEQPTGGELIPALIHTGLFAMIKLAEIGVGVLLLAHVFVPLAIAAAVPITVVIAWVNLVLAHGVFPTCVGIVVLAANFIMALGYWNRYRPMLAPFAGLPGRTIALLLAALGMSTAMTTAASAQPPLSVQTEFVTVNRLATALYRPAAGPPPHIGFIYMNGGSGAMSHPACRGLAARGFIALCAASSREGNPMNSPWENVALDVKAEAEYLRGLPGIDRVILFGHSGGGAVASFYQAVAENGIGFCQDPQKLTACGSQLAGMRPADAVVFPDAHPGLGVMGMRQINPSVTFNPAGVHVDPGLDPFAVANGFNPHGPSHYTPAFQKRYFAAQAAMMQKLIDRALKTRAAEPPIDPRSHLVLIPFWTITSHLDILDPTIPGLMQTAQPRRLLRDNGTIVTGPIASVAPPGLMFMSQTGVKAMFVDEIADFLSQGAVRATDSLDTIDYCTSNSVTACNVRSIHAPVLFEAMGASTFIGDDERMYEHSASHDKDFIVIEGALHGLQPCVPCETSPGQYSHSFDNALDYIARWSNGHFPPARQ